MKRILLILLCLAFWLPSNASMVRLPYVQDVQAGMVIGSGGGGGAATNYLNDANIVSWWMLEEESGTRYDGSTNDNDLTDVETVTRSATHVQGAYAAQFTAANYECIYITDANLAPSTFPGKTSTGGTGAFSVGGWFYMSDTGSERYLITKGNPATEHCSFTLRYDGTNFIFEVSTTGWSTTAITGGTTALATTWYHVVGVYDESYIQLWVGTVAGSSAQDATQVAYTDGVRLDDGPFIIGAKTETGAVPNNGLVDEVFIFADALSGTEIEEIRNSGLAGDR